jgi:hypothetical protein
MANRRSTRINQRGEINIGSAINSASYAGNSLVGILLMTVPIWIGLGVSALAAGIVHLGVIWVNKHFLKGDRPGAEQAPRHRGQPSECTICMALLWTPSELTLDKLRDVCALATKQHWQEVKEDIPVWIWTLIGA